MKGLKDLIVDIIKLDIFQILNLKHQSCLYEFRWCLSLPLHLRKTKLVKKKLFIL